MYRRSDGIVDFDKRTCIGCKACMAACPYDAIFINPEDHSAEKCNFCAHRRRRRPSWRSESPTPARPAAPPPAPRSRSGARRSTPVPAASTWRPSRPRRDVAELLEQVRPPSHPHPAPPGDLERAHLAHRVPVGAQRAVVPSPALPRRRAWPPRGLLLPGLQPGVDQPRRVLLDRGADRRSEGGPARRAHPDVVGDGLPGRLRPPHGRGLGTARRRWTRSPTPTPSGSTPPRPLPWESPPGTWCAWRRRSAITWCGPG